MKRLLVIFALLLSISIIFTGCQSGTSETVGTKKLSNEYESIVRGYALELLSFNNTKMGFKAAGSEADFKSAAYIVEEMKEIGLTNVTKEEITLDGWDVKDAVLTIFCGCTEEGKLDVKSVGYYPTNMDFENENFRLYDIADGTELQYQGKDVKGQLVILSTSENLLESIELAKEKGVAGIIVSSGLETYVSTSIVENLPVDMPILAVSRNSLNIVRQYKVDDYVDVVLTAYSKVTEDVKTYNVVGEIEGKNKNKVIYITANRDGLYKDFMGSGVSVGELFLIANELVESGYKPESTIKFVVTTGQEWGKVGKTENEGIKAQLESNVSWVENAKAVIVLDGSYPLKDTVNTATQGSSEVVEFLTKYNKNFTDNGYRFKNSISEISGDRVTEALVWVDYGVPTILQAEPKDSAFSKIEKNSGDLASLTIDNEQLNFLVDYYTNMIKEIDRVKSFK